MVAVDQGQGRTPGRQPGDEVVGAVDRVDHPGAAAGCGRTFLADDAVIGSSNGQPADDHRLGGLVGVGDDVADAGFAIDGQAGQQHAGGQPAGGLDQRTGQFRVGERRIFSIRMLRVKDVRVDLGHQPTVTTLDGRHS